MTPRHVGDDGTGRERIIVIGEAPGAHEDSQGKPFVGPSGWKVQELMRGVGLGRRDAYWTNVYPYRPKANKIETVPKAELAQWIDALHERLAALDDPYVIVPMGNTALRALTGRSNITKNRGFIDSYTDRNGRSIKVIGTIHPAALFRTPTYERTVRKDWTRIAGDATFREPRLPAYEHFTTPTLDDIEGFYWDAAESGAPLSIDIETYGGTIGCVGFGYTALTSFTIPTTERYWHGSPSALEDVWTWILKLCALPNDKVLQNGLFDAYWLWLDKGVRMRNFRWDTMGMHHALDAADEHGLGYMASCDLRCAPWKHIPKDPEAQARYPSDAQAVYAYNGMDVCHQWELADLFSAQLAAKGRVGFYDDHYRALLAPLLELMTHGIAVDGVRRERRFARLISKCITLQDELTQITGSPLYSTTKNKKRDALGKIADLSSKKITEYLYNVLRLPKQINRDTGKLTGDEVAIRKLMLKHGEAPPADVTFDAAEALTTLNALGDVQSPRPKSWVVHWTCGRILDYRRTKKLSEFVADTKTDADGRFRSSYGFAPETGRLSSSKNPMGRCGNAQNIDREVRDVYVPDDGCVFVEVDLSQAEDRIVKVLTRAPHLIARARAAPWDNDEHKRAACAIFGIKLADVTKPQRYLAKRGRHAGNYGMRGNTLSEQLLKDGYTYTPDECTSMITAILDRDTPEVRDWQKEIRSRVIRDRRLVNPFTRELLFTYDRLDDDTYRRAYAFIPQSTVPAILNTFAFAPLGKWLKANGLRSRINANVHDSLLLSCPPHEVWPVWEYLRAALERPVDYEGISLTIPVELKIGSTWGSLHEFKEGPPTIDVVRRCLEQISSRGYGTPAVQIAQATHAGTL